MVSIKLSAYSRNKMNQKVTLCSVIHFKFHCVIVLRISSIHTWYGTRPVFVRLIREQKNTRKMRNIYGAAAIIWEMKWRRCWWHKWWCRYLNSARLIYAVPANEILFRSAFRLLFNLRPSSVSACGALQIYSTTTTWKSTSVLNALELKLNNDNVIQKWIWSYLISFACWLTRASPHFIEMLSSNGIFSLFFHCS